MMTSNNSLMHKTSFGTVIYSTGSEIVLVTEGGAQVFVGRKTSKGIEAQADRSTGKTKAQIADLLTKAHNEVKVQREIEDGNQVAAAMFGLDNAPRL